MPPTKGRQPKIDQFLRKENAGANSEEVGEVPSRGVRGGGVRSGGVRSGGVRSGGVRGGGVRSGGVRDQGVRSGGLRDQGVRGGRVPGGGVPGGVSEENPDATQEETAGGEVEEQHGHTISWKYDKEKAKYSLYCNNAGTIYESLQRSEQFQKLEQKIAKGHPEKKKELVILISVKKAISSHFPCLHISTENLIIKYINAKDNQTTTESIKIENPGEIITFSMKTSGTRNISMVVMKNLELKKIVDEVLVYGYKGQTVREALEQDGRFNDEVLQSNYLLEDTKDGKLAEISDSVDVLHGKCYWVKRNGKNGTKQQATSSSTASPKGNQPTPNQSNQPTPNQSNQPTPNQSNQPTPNMSSQLSIYQPIPNSEDLLQRLRSQFKDLVKLMKERQNLTPKAVQNHLSQEFGKNTMFCHEVSTMRRLLELGDSVCQVRIIDKAAGSGFLLFGKYILTNGHVVLNEPNKLRENITVVFSYEELADKQLAMDVEVIAFDYCADDKGQKHDWALLEVCGDLNTQPIKAKPLLEHLGSVTESGQICIIGHPGGKVKMIDPCFTIPLSKRKQKMFVTRNYFFPELMDMNIHTYESCFYYGSSGSPVFDHDLKVVSMHSGGFPEKDGHFLEYSHPLSLITAQIINHIVISKKVHVLLAMITCNIPKVVMDTIKEIVKCNPTEFVWTEDEIINLTESFREEELLRVFFRNFSQWDEAMDTSS